MARSRRSSTPSGFATDTVGQVRRDPSVHQMGRQLATLRRAHPRWVRLHRIGRSVGGRPIRLVEITDRDVPDDDKERVLLIGAEHGNEHSAATCLLEIIGWLLSPEADRVRRTQRVLVVACANPDGYEDMTAVNRNGVNLYGDFQLDGPPSQPESRAIWEVLNQYQPEVFCSLHGHWRAVPAPGLYIENNGGSYGNSMYDRPHSRLIAEEMARAAERLGFPQDRMEEDRQRILPLLPGYEHHSFGSGLRITPGVCAYHRFHALVFSMEVMIEASGLARIRRLLEIGSRPWRGERQPGFPVRVIAQHGDGFVLANGTTAAQRRASRIELWQNNQELTVIHLPHITELGRASIGLTVDRSIRKLRAVTVADVLDGLRSEPNLDMDGLRGAYRDRLDAHWALGNDGQVQLPGDKWQRPDLSRFRPLGEIRHGVSLRLRLPRPIRVTEVLGNGRPLKRSATEGYQTWTTRAGWTFLQVNVPPGRSVFCPAGPIKTVLVTARYEWR